MKEYIITEEYIDRLYEDEGSTFGLDMRPQLIRCKDCKYRDEFGRCNLFKQFTPHVLENGYCSDAKREEE